MKVILNSNAIQHDTGKALLIKLPNVDYAFWHPKRLCRTNGKGGYQLSVWFANRDWSVKINKLGVKTPQVTDSTAGEMVDDYNLQVVD